MGCFPGWSECTQIAVMGVGGGREKRNLKLGEGFVPLTGVKEKVLAHPGCLFFHTYLILAYLLCARKSDFESALWFISS